MLLYIIAAVIVLILKIMNIIDVSVFVFLIPYFFASIFIIVTDIKIENGFFFYHKRNKSNQQKQSGELSLQAIEYYDFKGFWFFKSIKIAYQNGSKVCYLKLPLYFYTSSQISQLKTCMTPDKKF